MEPTYNCEQQELYGIGRLGYQSVIDYLAQFTAFKPKYIAAFITAREAEIDAAEALPDEEQRQEAERTFRVVLKTKATEGMALWQTLKRYITDAFPENEVDIKLDAAGQQHYRKAGKDNWTSVKRLMLDGDAFITANSVTLLAADNMPPTFAATFTAGKTTIDTAYDNFFNASQGSEVDTQTKITANNDIHAKMMSMFLDGQEIFKTNEAVKKLFTFEQVLLTLSGPGVAGIRGLIKSSLTGLPINATAHISIFGTEHETDSDENSRYKIEGVAAGIYTIVITCPGFQELQIPNIEIETGTMKTLNITLTPL